jgi:clan AA aspartic protease
VESVANFRGFFWIFLVYYTKEIGMGMVHAEITLKNAIDMGNARRGMIKDSEIRQTTVTAVVDTGAGTLVINEAIREKLGLKITGKRRATLADGAAHDYEVTEPVSVHWKNRDSPCKAYVVPNANKVLLGAIPLEDMDLIVNPAKQELVGAHGDEIMTYLY